MTSAVDTNVLLDVLIPGAPFAQASKLALGSALRVGVLVMNDIVYAELGAYFHDSAELDDFLRATGIQLQRTGTAALFAAGQAWSGYLRRRSAVLQCSKCGRKNEFYCEGCGVMIGPRQHIAADFVIGAHALLQTDRLLTRDLGFYAAHFPGLSLT